VISFKLNIESDLAFNNERSDFSSYSSDFSKILSFSIFKDWFNYL